MNILARGTGVRGTPASRRLLLLLLLLLLPLLASAWYKHVANPHYHTVGRAAGLLMGLRSPYVWCRALRPAAEPLAWDTLGLGTAPKGLSPRDTLSSGPAVRYAVLPFSGVQELWGVRHSSSRAGLPVSAPRSPRLNLSRGWTRIPGTQRSRPETSESLAQP